MSFGNWNVIMLMGNGKRENMHHEQDRWVARRALCEFVYTLGVHMCLCAFCMMLSRITQWMAMYALCVKVSRIIH